VGHAQPLRTIVAIAMSQCDVFWAAGGYPRNVLPASYDELLSITAREAAKVGA